MIIEMNDVKEITLCPPSFYPEQEENEVKEKAFEIYTHTVSANILCPNQTNVDFDYIAEESFDAARAFIREANYQATKHAKYEIEKTA
jgi:hypothetical protein